MKDITLITDGSCLGNPGAGGYAFILWYMDTERVVSGYVADTTNNRMELEAAIEGLSALTEPCKVRLITDSEYLRRGVTEWLPNWKTNNWRTADKKPVKNQDLWLRLDQLIQYHKVSFEWVKGHAGNPHNERCDRIAQAAARQQVVDYKRKRS